jgi:hypothetical protein
MDYRRQLPLNMENIKYWDHEKTQYHLRMSGEHRHHLDKKLGVSLDEIEGMSIRQKKDIIKSRAKIIQQIKNNRYRFHSRGKGALI